MTKQRAQRLSELLKKEISEIILREVKDPRIGFVSVTGIDVSGDLRHAKVFVSVYGNKQERSDTMAGLEKATGFIRKLLAERINVYHTPELLFRYDDSIQHGVHINELLEKVKNEQEERGEA
ncbi:MAG: 30S ribosome-binding factor RbfA [Halanaerobiales bacterium]|nr:30S ribosome-binding factor RbfA [Halanaerobiales bacterium]